LNDKGGGTSAVRNYQSIYVGSISSQIYRI
jgi:hypothetical protein